MAEPFNITVDSLQLLPPDFTSFWLLNVHYFKNQNKKVRIRNLFPLYTSNRMLLEFRC